MTTIGPTATSPDAPPPAPPEVEDHGWQRAVPLFLVVVAGIAISVVTGTFPVVAFILAIIAMVMIHEFGHFVTAKWSNMKVTEFFFGFGPRLWWFRKGETEYGVKALPLGGYVKIIGMSNVEKNVDPADEPRTYRQQSYPKRLLVAVAGIFTHFIVAFILLVLIWTVIGVPNHDKPTTKIGSISRLASGPSPAKKAGLEVGDRLVSINGQRVNNWEEVPSLIRGNANSPIPVVVERDGRQLTLTPTPVECTEAKYGFLGIGPAFASERDAPLKGTAQAAVSLRDITFASVKALGSFFTPGSLKDYAGTLRERPEPEAPSASSCEAVEEEARFLSIVGVTRLAGQAASTGWFVVVYLLVLLNIFVGVFNLVPLLPLDGGHIAIATYERLRSRAGRRYHADVSKMVPVAAVVVTVLVMIGISALWLDIVRPIDNPFQ